MRWLLSATVGLAFLIAACADNDASSPTAIPIETPSATPTPSSETPLVAPGPSIRRDSSENDLLFFVDGVLYLDEGPGGQLRRLPAGDDCSRDGKYYSLSWSPDGSKLLCASWSGGVVLMDSAGVARARFTGYISSCEWSPDSLNLLCLHGSDTPVLALLDGNLQVMTDLAGSSSFVGAYRFDGLSHWSPDGSKFAYYAASGDEVVVTSTADLDQKQTLAGYRPMAWMDETSLLVGQGTWDTDFTTTTRYETSVWDIETGALSRLPGLDYDGAAGRRAWQTWLLPETRQAFALTPRDSYPLGLGVIDIDTGAIKELTGSKIGFPSDGIPPGNIWLSSDGQHLWWQEVGEGITIQRASIMTFEVEDIGHRLAGPASVSNDERAIAFSVFGPPAAPAYIAVEDLDGTGQAKIAIPSDDPPVFAWRPAP